MSFWMNLKVKTKSLCLVAIAVVTLVVIAAASLQKMRVMSADQEAMNTSVIHVAMLNDMKNDLLAIRLDLVYMMLLEDPAQIKDKADDLEKRKQRIEETRSKFMKYDLDAKEKGLIAAFKQGYDEYLVQGTKLQQLTQQSAGNPAARKDTVAFATSSVAPLYKKPADAIPPLPPARRQGRPPVERCSWARSWPGEASSVSRDAPRWAEVGRGPRLAPPITLITSSWPAFMGSDQGLSGFEMDRPGDD